MESSALQDALSASVKTEPCEDDISYESVSTESEPSHSDMRVKEELVGVSAAAAAAGLYAGHAVKDELVLGPELVERRRARHAPRAFNLATEVKQEPSCEPVPSRKFMLRDCCVRLQRLAEEALPSRSTKGWDSPRQVKITNVQKIRRTAVGNFTKNNAFNLGLKVAQEPCEITRDRTFRVRECSVQLERLVVDTLLTDTRSSEDGDSFRRAGADVEHVDRNTVIKNVKDNNRGEGQTPQNKSSGRQNSYQCGDCEFATARKNSLIIHVRRHNNEKPYKCNQCSYASTRRDTLQIHKLIHSSTKAYKCNQCSYATAYKSYIRIHERKHNGEKPYKCDQCSFACANKYYLHYHNRKHTNELFKCGLCKYVSVQKSNLRTHIVQMHNDTKPYKCGQCSYASSQKSVIREHEKIHSGVKPYKCNQCSYAGVNKYHLKLHEKRHTEYGNEKLHKCEKCSYASAEKGNLVRHRLLHSGTKPYKCGQCSFASAHQSALRGHESKHTGAKPYKCNQCNYANCAKRSLLLHKMVHIGTKP